MKKKKTAPRKGEMPYQTKKHQCGKKISFILQQKRTAAHESQREPETRCATTVQNGGDSKLRSTKNLFPISRAKNFSTRRTPLEGRKVGNQAERATAEYRRGNVDDNRTRPARRGRL